LGPDDPGLAGRSQIVERLPKLLVVAAGVALTAFALATVEPLDQPILVALDMAAGWAFLLGALAIGFGGKAGRVAAIESGIGLTWFLGGVLHRGPLVHLLLCGPDGRVKGRVVAGVVVLGYVDALVETFRPLEPLGVAVALATVFVALLGVRGTRGPLRRTRLILATSGFAIVATLIVGWWAAASGRLDRTSILVAYDLVLIGTAIAVTADRRWSGWSRAAVTGLVVELGDRADAGSLRDRLAHALGDPSLVVAYRTDKGGEHIDEAGRPVELPAPGSARAVTPITSRGEPLGFLIHDPAVLADPRLAGPVVAAAGLAVANARLQSDIRRQTAEVEASRRRIVRAGDRQRRRIERELSYGVLARLDAVDDDLATLVPVGAAPTPSVAMARETLALARDELGRFARGVYPAALAEHGLPVAVSDIAARGGVPVTVRLPSVRLSGEIEAAAYFVCAEALTNVAKHARATHAEVSGTIETDRLRIAISDDGEGGADPHGSGLRGLAGRVEGVGGRLRVVSPSGGGTRIEAGLPLGELGLA
jgi:signal transduction histidine kinase